MATPAEEELKARAAFNLKRVMEISSTATKTAIVSFSALAVIWFGQIQPQYELLLKMYPRLPAAYSQVRKLGKDVPKTESAEEKEPVSKKPSTNTREASYDPKVKLAQVAQENEKSKATQVAADQFEKLASLVNTVSFDIFGLKLSVPPLWASLIWNILLLALLLYLAHARSAVWRLCADALTTLKQMGKGADDLDEIAGSGPVWIAPPPSRVSKTQIATIEDLRSAFGWNRLETLPSIAATTGFLLLGLLQLTVTLQGFNVIKSATVFTDTISDKKVSGYENISLERKITEVTSRYETTSASMDTEGNSITVDQKIKQLIVGPVEASLLSLSLSLMLVVMLFLVVWWFRPWAVPSRARNNPQRMASTVLVLVVLICLFLTLEWLRPGLGSSMADKLATFLPGLFRFVTASVLTFCLIELSVVALSPSRAHSPLVKDGKTD